MGEEGLQVGREPACGLVGSDLSRIREALGERLGAGDPGTVHRFLLFRRPARREAGGGALASAAIASADGAVGAGAATCATGAARAVAASNVRASSADPRCHAWATASAFRPGASA